MRLAVDRQAKPEAITIRQYVTALSGFSDEVIRQVCDDLGGQSVAEYQPRFPSKDVLISACRKLQAELSRPSSAKYFCGDCASEDGWLYFDAPKNGNRLCGADIVRAERRYAMRCPCGGTETDWRTLHQEIEYRRRAQPASADRAVIERARVAGQ